MSINPNIVNEGKPVSIPRISLDSTGREDFEQTWLIETPTGLGEFSTYDALAYHINDLKSANVSIQDLSKNVKAYVGTQTAYFWYEEPVTGKVILGTQLYIKPNALVVSITGKNPKYTGKPPYASDLYNAILDNTGRSIRLMSDDAISDEGKQLWDRLFKQGNKVSIYDKQQPGKTFKTFDSQEEMDSYFKHDDTEFARYQYVLSEHGETLAETKAFFNIRRHRELITGLL